MATAPVRFGPFLLERKLAIGGVLVLCCAVGAAAVAAAVMALLH